MLVLVFKAADYSETYPPRIARKPEAVFLVRLGSSWELGARSFPARNELSMLFPYTSFSAGNELLLKLTKNTASV
jgi:hypothetical protein